MTFNEHYYGSATRYPKPSAGNNQLNAQALSLTLNLVTHLLSSDFYRWPFRNISKEIRR